MSSDITAKEAGRRGGLATRAKYGGTDHFSRIGALAPPKPPAFYARIAPLGGAATKAKFPRPHYQAIGRKGGETLLMHRGKSYFSDISRAGWAARKARATTP